MVKRKDARESPVERMDRLEARRLLPPGWTLTEAVRLASRMARAPAGEAVTVAVAVERFLRSQLSVVSVGTWTFYEENLRALERLHGSVLLRDVDRGWLTEYFADLPRGRPQRWRAVRRLLKWAVAEGLLSEYRAEGFAVRVKRPERIAVLTRPEVARLLQEGGVCTAALALMVLAGVRPYEVRAPWKPAMTWAQVDAKGRMIRIEADQAKTGVSRVLDECLPPVLWLWLEQGRRRMESAGMPVGRADPVCPMMGAQVTRRAKTIVGRWAPDILRHTFASCHLATFADLTRLSLLMGHEGETRMIHRHYAARVERWEAMRVFYCLVGCWREA